MTMAPEGRVDMPLGEAIAGDGFTVRYFRKQTDLYKVFPAAELLARPACA